MSAPSFAERAALLRQRCLERKISPRSNFRDVRPVVDAESMRRTENIGSWQIRVGERTKDRLLALRFETDDLELLAGRCVPAKAESAEIEAAKKYLSAQCKGYPSGQTGHCQLNYDEIFSAGISGVTARINKLAAGKKRTAEEIDTLKSFVTALEGFSGMIGNAGKAALRSAKNAPEWREKELAEIAESCVRIQSGPPQSFRDAIQLLWFMIMGAELADDAGLTSPGRLDRALWPFYERDIRNGAVDDEKALALIEALYFLINNLIPNGLAIAVMVGGTDVSGKDTTNRLSYLCLEALRRTNMVYPTVGVCWNKNTPEDLSALAVELISKGCVTPAFFNDEVIQKGLRHYGMSPENAASYINSTCVEITPAGCSNVWVASPYFSLCKILLEEIDAPAETVPRDFDSFLQGYFKRLGVKIAEAVKTQSEHRESRRLYGGKPLQSVFTRDCIGRARDIDNGGALANWVECSFVGAANLADSLHVIKNEVFEKKSMDFAGLKKILDSNFEGCENVRLRFLEGYDKYGNAKESVDSLLKALASFISEECAKHKVPPYESHFIPGTFCWIMHERLGSECGATPDGRRKGEPFADGGGPAQGREKNGPTAAVLSTTSWEHWLLIGGLAFNMRFSRALFGTPAAERKLWALIRTFLERGGFETQINVLDREILVKAERNPEAYSGLVVRIGGYTDYFTKLSPAMRGEVMRRTEYLTL